MKTAINYMHGDILEKSKKINQSNDIIVLLINNLEKEDFLPIIEYSHFKKNILVIFDKRSINEYNECSIDYLVQDFKSCDTIVSHLKKFTKEKQKKIIGVVGLDEEYHYTVSKKIADAFHLQHSIFPVHF